jgi:hypothetical protein
MREPNAIPLFLGRPQGKRRIDISKSVLSNEAAWRSIMHEELFRCRNVASAVGHDENLHRARGTARSYSSAFVSYFRFFRPAQEGDRRRVSITFALQPREDSE